MQNTTNFNLQKPDYNNVADIQVLNNNFDQIDNGIAPFFVATLNSSNVYKVTTGVNITSISDGFGIRVAIPSDSTGAVSIIIDGLTAVPVKKPNGGAVSNFKANGVYALTYYNGNFILVSGGGCDGDKVTATERDVLINKTFIGSDEEIHTGTMPQLGTVTKQLGINETYTLGEGHINSLKVTQNIPTIGAKTYTPTTTDQIISAGRYLTGNQTIKGDANLKSENIVTGVNIFGVSGSGRRVASGTLTPSSGRALSFDQIGFVPSVFIIHQQIKYEKKVDHITCVLTKRALELSGENYIQAQLIHTWFDSNGNERSTCNAIVSWYSDGYYINTTQSQPYDWWAIQ